MAYAQNFSYINAFDLSEEELEYELGIRNVLQEEPELQKRERLKNCYKNERNKPIVVSESIYFANERPLGLRKLEEIEEGLKGDFHVRWISQLRHWKERIDRSKVVDLAQEEQKYDMVMAIRKLMITYKETARRLMNLSDSEDGKLDNAMGGLDLHQEWNKHKQNQEHFEGNIKFHSSLAKTAQKEGNRLQGKFFNSEPGQKTVGELFKNLPTIQGLQIGAETAKSMMQEREDRMKGSRLGAIPKHPKKSQKQIKEVQMVEGRDSEPRKHEKNSKKKKARKISSSEDDSSSLDSLSSLLSSESSNEISSPSYEDRFYTPNRRDERMHHYRLDRWGIQFSGDSHGMDVADFVFQVNELIAAERIPNDRFLDQAFILFTGEARRWYFTCKKKYKTWDSFSKHLKIRFGDPNKDSKILQEIKDRKQKKGESFVAFCSEIEGMFERMTKQYSERKRLKVLRNNMRRWYKTKLTFYKIKNIAHLNMLCQQLDKDSGRIYSRSAPFSRKQVRNIEASSDSSSSSSDEAEICAYEGKGRHQWKDRSKQSNQNTLEPLTPPEKQRQLETLCWNCRKYGHRWRDCKHAKVIFCHACGTSGVTFFTCPKSHVLPQQTQKNESLERD